MRLWMLLFLFTVPSEAVTFVWQPNPEGDITNYVIRLGTNSGSYVASTNCGNFTNLTISSHALFAGTNYAVLTAQNSAGFESDLSAEVVFVLPSAPKNFRVKLSMDYAPAPTGPWIETLSLTNSFAVQDTAYFRGRLDIQPSSGLP